MVPFADEEEREAPDRRECVAGDEPERLGAARSNRRPKPLSKSRATENAVKTPPNAAPWRRTNAYWNDV